MERDGTCRATRRDGRPCQSAVVLPSGFCGMHDPARREAMAAARRRGGRNRSNAEWLKGALPERLGPTLTRLEQALVELHTGALEPRVGSAMASVAKAIASIVQVGELELRLRQLESAAAQEER